MLEQWKDIEGFENLYQISTLGNVRSLPKGGGNGNRARLLKQEVLAGGNTSYRRVTLSSNGVTKRFSVHILVAKAFIPNANKAPFVNHIDNNGENNCLTNLEWCTHSENMIHAQKQGRLTHAQKAGGLTTKLQCEKQQLEKFTKVLGVNFIRYFQEGVKPKRRSFIEFHCINCSAVRKTRVDSEIVRFSKYFCKNCT